jgi:hypothetical protein
MDTPTKCVSWRIDKRLRLGFGRRWPAAISSLATNLFHPTVFFA